VARGEEVVSRAVRFWKLEGAGNDFLGSMEDREGFDFLVLGLRASVIADVG
jgi:hypothetical protein